MPAYWLSFRIADAIAFQGTYDDRYSALVSAAAGGSARFWVETTSFIAFDSPEALEPLASRLKQTIDPTKDLFLLKRMNAPGGIICGNNEDDSIFKLMAGENGQSYLKNLV